MDTVNTTAFAAPPSSHALLAVRTTACTCLHSKLPSRRAAFATRPARRVLSPRMTAAEPETEPEPEAPIPPPPELETEEEEEEVGTTSATEILKTLREESAADKTPSTRSMLGVYRDVDGKSNVWAVEPLEETDTRPQLSKTTLIVVAAAFIVVALLVLPLLPFTNPDQV